MAKDSTPSPQTAEAAPSMEDILRTIRGVISNGAPPAEEPTSAEHTEEEAQGDVLDLTEMVPEPEATSPLFAGDETQQKNVLEDIDALLNPDAPAGEMTPEIEALLNPVATSEPIEAIPAQPDPEPLPEPIQEAPKPSVVAAPEPEPSAPMPLAENTSMHHVLSEATATATRAAFEELKHKSPKPHTDAPVLRSGTSLEDLVVEALRPYLMDWMDRNLPILVKQIVEKEIRRLVPQDTD